MRVFFAAALSVLLGLSTSAQAPAPALTEADFKGATVGFMHAIHATDNLDATAAFYKEVFGLSSAIRPFAGDGPRLLTDSPEANLRVSMLPIPGQGFNFELTEFTNTPTRTLGQQPALSDPGAPHMKFLVRDIEPVMTAREETGAPDHHHVEGPGGGEDAVRRRPGDLLPRSRRLHRRGGADSRAGRRAGRQRHRRDHGRDRARHGRRHEVLGRAPRPRAGRRQERSPSDPARLDLYGIAKGGVLPHDERGVSRQPRAHRVPRVQGRCRARNSRSASPIPARRAWPSA